MFQTLVEFAEFVLDYASELTILTEFFGLMFWLLGWF
jgi:hypothetical protein